MQNTTIQISGNNAQGNPILSVITKRTYNINNDGTCSLSEEQLPLIESPTFYDENEDILNNDTDLYPHKPLTDIIVKGKARTTDKTTSFSASVEIDKQYRNFNIIGDRKLYRNQVNKLVFSDPEIITEIPLTYNFAYGGKDLIAEQPIREKIEADEDLKHLKDVLDLFKGSPFRYPRNPEGKGYILETSDAALENFELPNIEDPKRLLTPETIVCEKIENWCKMPLPMSTDWVHPGWFPRVAYFGSYPIPESFDEDAYEIRKKLVDADILKSSIDNKKQYFNYRACNGASLGLQARHFLGGESCRLINIHPTQTEFVFKLPFDQPKIKIDNRKDKLVKANVTMHSVIIEPDSNRLSIVWCGSIKALRPYMEHELKNMPFEVQWK